jgi:hypothetical protein
MEFLGEPRLSGVVDGLIARSPACPDHATAFSRVWPSLSGSLNGCFPNFVRKDERVVAGFSGVLVKSESTVHLKKVCCRDVLFL